MKFLHFAVVVVCLFILTMSAHAQTVEDGYAAYDADDYETAKSIFIPLADAGNAKAMNAIGVMYSQGRGYPKDRKLACDWYERSAEIGYISAQNNLSICYEDGDGRPKNMDKALDWTERAAAQGDLDSQVSLIRMYSGIDKNKAKFWGQKALNRNSAMARVAMWGYDIPHTGLQASRLDILCVYVMIGLFGKPWDYCDYKD